MAIDTTSGGVVFGTGDFYTNILNSHFLPAVADTVITPNVLLSRLPRNKERVEGQDVVFPTHIGRNTGVNSIGPDGTLPDPGSQQYDQFQFPVRHTYGRIKFDGISMDASKSDVASWLRVVESEVKGLAVDLSRQRQRQFHNDGSGRLGQVSPDPGTGTTDFTLIDNADLPGNNSDMTVSRWIKAGMNLAFVTSGGTVNDAGTVDSVSGSTITMTANLAAGVANNDYVVLCSESGSTAAADTGFQREPMGIMGIIDDGNPSDGVTGFQGISATGATESWHRANLLDNSGTNRTLTTSLMDQAYTKSIEIGDAAPSLILGNFGAVRAYADTLLDQRRYVNVDTFDGGYKALAYNDVPVIADRDSFNNRLYFIVESDLQVYVMSDPSWMSMDGSIYHRLANKDAYQATMYCRETLGSEVRDVHTLLLDLTEA